MLLIFLNLLCGGIYALPENGFATNINIRNSDSQWYANPDGTGTSYPTIIMEYRLKGDGIKGVQGVTIAVDATKLKWVGYSADGLSVDDHIDKLFAAGDSPVKFDNENFYDLKDPVGDADQWVYSQYNFNSVTLSEDENTLYILLQPSQNKTVNYAGFTTVVSLRFAVVSGTEYQTDSIRYPNETERNFLNQSFIIAMNDGTSGYFYGEKSGNNTLEASPVTNDSGVNITGLVTGYNPKNNPVVRLKQGDEVKYIAALGVAVTSNTITHTFSFVGVAAGTYDLVIEKAVHLDYTIKNIQVSTDNINLTTDSRANISKITLLCGDIDGNGYINPDDLGILLRGENFGKTTVNAINKLTDLDGNGWINPDDLGLLLRGEHFGKSNVTVYY
ncbi:MAG: EF-hand domain-containing protein [Eubacteriales bacterium]|nr:EF-hand domain-containing protein [Eubacteriales bacterium]